MNPVLVWGFISLLEIISFIIYNAATNSLKLEPEKNIWVWSNPHCDRGIALKKVLVLEYIQSNKIDARLWFRYWWSHYPITTNKVKIDFTWQKHHWIIVSCQTNTNYVSDNLVNANPEVNIVAQCLLAIFQNICNADESNDLSWNRSWSKNFYSHFFSHRKALFVNCQRYTHEVSNFFLVACLILGVDIRKSKSQSVIHKNSNHRTILLAFDEGSDVFQLQSWRIDHLKGDIQ